MGQIVQGDFSAGWNPSADQINGPDNALYRMDNCILDELGIVSLRPGSSKVNSVALATTDIRSLYSTALSGTRLRLAQGAGSVYGASGTGAFASIASGFDSSLDVQFSSYLGQVFMASGTVKNKYDGSTLRNWGITAPAVAPTTTIGAASNKVLASCDSVETTWTNDESASVSNVNGFDGTVNGARSVVASATTLRGVQSRDIGASSDFTDYGGGVSATDDDIVDMYVKMDDPTKVSYITLTIDFNGSAAATFDKDYAVFTWNPNQPKAVQSHMESQLASDYTVEGFQRQNVLDRAEERPGFAFTIRPDANGWHYLSVKRSAFSYVKTNDSAWWNTVRGVRVAFGGTGQATVAFDRIRIYGGNTKPLDGKYEYRFVYERAETAYAALSGPSPASSEIILKNENATVTCTNPADTQVTHIRLFRMGGTLDRFYRVARQAVSVYSGTIDIPDTLSDRAALILNIPLETDNAVPPNNIIGISEDYHTRIFCLSSDGQIYPSRLRNPDSFASGQVIRVLGASETGYWIKKAYGGLYVGTSKDIYRLEGTGAENPDGTLDFVLRPLNINSPPISSALAWDGNLLIYMASDGPRTFSGEASSPLRVETDLLWRGYTRYAVSPVNLASGRFRMAIAKGWLEIIMPEGTSTSSSAILWKYNLAQQRWYRHTYSQNWRSLYREQDGTLLAGDNAGFLWILEDATADGDSGATIPVTIWTRHYTLTKSKGDPVSLQARMDTGNISGTMTVHIEGNANAALTLSPQLNGEGIQQFSLSAVDRFRQIGLRFTGNYKTFRLYQYEINWSDLPDYRRFWQIGPVDLGTDFVWLREIRLKGFVQDTLTLTPYFDGIAKSAKTVSPSASDISIYLIRLGREYHGRQLSTLTLSSPLEFPLYWVEFLYRTSGGQSGKKRLQISDKD